MSEITQQEDYCLNCKTTLQGNYCHRCGQPKLDTHHDSFLHTMIHFLGDFVHFDSQIFRTAIPLLFKPGFLVNEYFKGKRARYLSPIKMYVFLSFLFFFVIFGLSGFTKGKNVHVNEKPSSAFSDNNKTGSDKSGGYMIWKELSDSLEINKNWKDSLVVLDGESYASVEQYDSIQQTLPEHKKDNWILYELKTRSLIFKDKILSDERNMFVNELIHSFTHNFPKVLFFLLPIFALLLKMLYRKKYYIEHLIFSITFYNFFFLFGSVVLLIGLVPFLENIVNVAYWLLPLLYLYLAMLFVYRQSVFKTAFKFGIFMLTFAMFLGFGLMLNVLFTFFSV